MISYKTLVKYLTKLYIKQFLISSIIIVVVLLITNTFDVLQKFKSSNLASRDFWELAILKIPYLFNEISALVSFISTFMFVRILTRQNELIIILSSGIPIWRVLIIPIIISFFIGIIILSIINPIGSYGLRSYEKLEKKVNKIPDLNFNISQSGIFFFENFAGNNRIIQTTSVNVKDKFLLDITILLVDEHNNLYKRIDAPKAIANTGSFKLINPTITTDTSSETLKELNFPTNLSINNLVQRFINPEIIPIWNLKNTIEKFIRSGLLVTRYQIYYYKQLFMPITLMAMSCVACWFISLNMRDNSNIKMAGIGLITGLCAYFFLQITLSILAYSGLPPMLSILLPILFIILISNFVILHFQEA